MKIFRSSKCSIKFANPAKLLQLKEVLQEYGRVANIFIEHFWNAGLPSKAELLKPIVDLTKKTWLTARLRKVAAREAIDMVNTPSIKMEGIYRSFTGGTVLSVLCCPKFSF